VERRDSAAPRRLEAEQSQPVADAPLREQAINRRWKTATAQQVAQAPGAERIEAADDDVALGRCSTRSTSRSSSCGLGAISSVCGSSTASIELLANGRGVVVRTYCALAVRVRRDPPVMLGACRLAEPRRLAPVADLKHLEAENVREQVRQYSALELEDGPAERCREPIV